MNHTQFAAVLMIIMILVSFLAVFINRLRQKAYSAYVRELYRREQLRNEAAELRHSIDSLCNKYAAIKKSR